MQQSSAYCNRIFHPLVFDESDGFLLPERFNNPFFYQPHPLCLIASDELKSYVAERTDWTDEVAKGKMFGVLIVKDSACNLGYLAAFSGILCGSNDQPGFVPPIYDLQNPDGFFIKEEKDISDINCRITELEASDELLFRRRIYNDALRSETNTLKAVRQRLKEQKLLRDSRREEGALSESEEKELIRESQFLKADAKRTERTLKETTDAALRNLKFLTDRIEDLKQERKQRSAALQKWLFEQFEMLNARGESKNLMEIFSGENQQMPPAGSGECCAPKLLQYAYKHGLRPLCMAEFWMGASPKNEIRVHGNFYPSCVSKCKPILRHMLEGLDVEENQQAVRMETTASKMRVIYEDEWICAVDKPAGMLSVPARDEAPNVYDIIKQSRPRLDECCMIVHRLDMDTSGVLILAKDKQAHKALQEQFARHEVCKKYIALLEGVVHTDCGTVDLPLSPNHDDRPRQMVDHVRGKQALTRYEVLSRSEQSTRIAFYPQTGRTHQLRVHSAHPEGLAHPIVGDPLYGRQSTRMFLHAESIEFTHPVTGLRMIVKSPCEF